MGEAAVCSNTATLPRAGEEQTKFRKVNVLLTFEQDSNI